MIEKKRRIPRNMFPDSRLRRAIFSGQVLSISYYNDEKAQLNLSSVVVSKKISKKAVVRNYLKRAIYEQIRINEGDFNIFFNGKTVFVPKNIDLANWHELLANDIREILQKVKNEKSIYISH